VLQRRPGQLWASMGPENRTVHHVPRGAFKGRKIGQSFDPVKKIKAFVNKFFAKSFTSRKLSHLETFCSFFKAHTDLLCFFHAWTGF
jgi:hypothetical protein